MSEGLRSEIAAYHMLTCVISIALLPSSNTHSPIPAETRLASRMKHAIPTHTSPESGEAPRLALFLAHNYHTSLRIAVSLDETRNPCIHLPRVWG
jgi:hypothetical protein